MARITLLLVVILLGGGCADTSQPSRAGDATAMLLVAMAAHVDEFDDEERELVRRVLATDRPGPRLVSVRFSTEWRTLIVRDRWLEVSEDGTASVACEETLNVSIDGPTRTRLYKWSNPLAAERLTQLHRCVSALKDDFVPDRDDGTSNPFRQWFIAMPAVRSERTAVVFTNDRMSLGHLAHIVAGANASSQSTPGSVERHDDQAELCLEILSDVTPVTLTGAAIDVFDELAERSERIGNAE